MLTHNIVYSVFPIVASLFHLIIIKRARERKASLIFITFFTILFFGNLFQALIYISLDHIPFISYRFTDLYLISAYFLFAVLPNLALNLSDAKYSWSKYIFVIPIVFTLLHIMGYMVDGYRISNGTVLHNDGQYAHIFDLFIVISSLSTISFLLFNVYTVSDNVQKSRNLIALIAFVPFIFFVLFLVALSNTDNPVSVVIIVPVVSIYISFIFYYLSGKNIIDLTIGPLAMSRRLRAAHMLLSILKNKNDLDRLTKYVNRIRYEEALARHKNNFKTASVELDVHPTTLRKALKDEGL